MQRSRRQPSLNDFQKIDLDEIRSLQEDNDPVNQALRSLRAWTAKALEQLAKPRAQVLVSAKR